MIVQEAAPGTVDQSVPVGPQIYGMLRERIIRGDLRPGHRISESEIAGQYSVSRQPVREAFIKLAEEELLEVRPQRGTFVRKISVAAVDDARFVREAIEADVVRLLAETPDPSLVRDLRRQIDLQRQAIDEGPESFIELDETFHKTLAVSAGKSFAWDVLEGLKAQMDRVRFLSLQQFPMQNLVGQHADIVEAVAAGSPSAAEKAMRGHLREILKDLPAIADSEPDLFIDRPDLAP